MIIYVEILREDLFRTLRRSLFARCPDRLSPLIVGVLVRMCILFQKFDVRRLANSIGSPSLPALGLKWSTSSARIEAAFETSDQRRYHVPCGACVHEQALRWAQIKWDKSESGNHLPETATYRCESCGAKWNDDQRLAAVHLGTWRAAAFQRHGRFSSLGAVLAVGEARRARDDVLAGEGLPGTVENVCDVESRGDLRGEGRAIRRDEPAFPARALYGPEVPAGVVVITAGIDTQDDRLEVEFCGWDSSEQCWSLDFRTIRGDPSTNTSWRDLDALLLEQRRRADGGVLPVAAACCDAMGDFTQAVYSFARERFGRRVWATKGVGGSRPVWPRKPTRNNVGKVPLFLIGVDSAKELIFARLRLPIGQPASFHFPDHYDVEYFEQLTSEKVITKYHHGHPRRIWVKTRARNEALDCKVLNVAALAGLLSMGLSLSRESERLASLANGMKVGTIRPSEQNLPPQRRVRSAGVQLNV